MAFIVVEIPHKLPVKAWYCESESAFIEIAANVHGLRFEKHNKESLASMFGEYDEIPSDYKAMLDANGEFVEVSGNDGSEFYSLDDAPSEFDAAQEVMFHDLHTGRVLSEYEANLYLQNTSGHQIIEARRQVRRVLTENF